MAVVSFALQVQFKMVLMFALMLTTVFIPFTPSSKTLDYATKATRLCHLYHSLWRFHLALQSFPLHWKCLASGSLVVHLTTFLVPTWPMTPSLFLHHPSTLLFFSKQLRFQTLKLFQISHQATPFHIFLAKMLTLAKPDSACSRPRPKKPSTAGKTKQHRTRLPISTLNIWLKKKKISSGLLAVL